jgi:hypothetical protein
MRERLEHEREILEKKLSVFKDNKFVFEEESHVYTYSGVKYDSVTTFLKTFKEPFQREYWLREKAKQRGVDVSLIEKEWTLAATKASSLGTKVHKWIENFWEDPTQEKPEDSEVLERVNKFLDIYEVKFKNLVPLQSELKIFSKKWRLAGTIDQPFLFWDEKMAKPLLLIGDWKTNKDFKHDEHPKGRYKKLLRPFNTLYENQHNEYSIQISLYRLILEDELGIETGGGFLVHIGPDGPAKIYPAKDLRFALRAYLDQNRNELDIFSL